MFLKVHFVLLPSLGSVFTAWGVLRFRTITSSMWAKLRRSERAAATAVIFVSGSMRTVSVVVLGRGIDMVLPYTHCTYAAAV